MPIFSFGTYFWRNICTILNKIKVMRILSILFFLSMFVGLSAQDQVTSDVSRALGSGDAGVLAKYFTSNVDLTVLNDESMCTSQQAVQKLQKFFSTHKPSKFDVKHKGTSKLDDQYRIGDLATAKGSYRVTFFMKKTPKGMKIKQLRIESDEDDF